MKISAIFVLLAAMLVAVCAVPFRDRPIISRPNPRNPGFPTFPGQGPFNPRPPSGPWRYRRSPGGKITVDQPINGKGSVAVDGTQKVYEGDHGAIYLYGGGKATQGQNPEAQAGIRGEFTWGGESAREAARIEARMAEIDRLRHEAKID